MYMDEGELEFDEDEMAALEGQHLVAELLCCVLFVVYHSTVLCQQSNA